MSTNDNIPDEAYMAPEQIKAMLERVAVIDGYGPSAEVELSFRTTDGEWVADIEWPSWWPPWVSSEFLEQQGYKVITA